MTTTHKVASAVLVVILAATIFGVVRTGRDDGSATLRRSKVVGAAAGPAVDQTELQTAQKLAQLADKPEEQPLRKLSAQQKIPKSPKPASRSLSTLISKPASPISSSSRSSALSASLTPS